MNNDKPSEWALSRAEKIPNILYGASIIDVAMALDKALIEAEQIAEAVDRRATEI